jgi:hypothetical protein
MAKHKKKKKQAEMAALADAPAGGGQCILRPIDDSPDFEAGTGASVTLFTHDHVGMVLIAKAEYGGQQLVPAGQAVARITFTVRKDRNTLKLVFVFSASTTGRGELREDCGGGESQFIRALDGDEPLQLVRIIGR